MWDKREMELLYSHCHLVVMNVALVYLSGMTPHDYLATYPCFFWFKHVKNFFWSLSAMIIMFILPDIISNKILALLLLLLPSFVFLGPQHHTIKLLICYYLKTSLKLLLVWFCMINYLLFVWNQGRLWYWEDCSGL